MTVPVRIPLGASTTNGMWYVDVDTAGSDDAPTWIPVLGISEFKPNFEPNLEDDSDFDSKGFQSETKTAEKWSAELKVGRKVQRTNATAYDPGQEFIRTKSIGKMGPANSVHVRFYEMTEDGPRVEAYEGWAAAQWSPDGGKMSDLTTVSVALSGQGELKEIPHPDGGAAGAPTVNGLDDTSGPAAGGELVTISGTNLGSATAVKFGANDAGDFDILSPTRIVAVSPAGAAGTVDITVTTAAGISGTSAATKYTYA